MAAAGGSAKGLASMGTGPFAVVCATGDYPKLEFPDGAGFTVGP
jgi:hypothetical protein